MDSDFYFSINSAMIKTRRGRKLISEIPKELILTETDFPYINNSSIDKVQEYLSTTWNISKDKVDGIIDSNFKKLLNTIR